MDLDPSALWEFDQFLLSDESLGMPNYKEVSRALHELQTRTNSLISDDVPLPDGFPAPQLVLPESGFAADCCTFNGYWFCSRRLREALDQPERVVQFTPSKSSPAATRFGRRIMV